ncbi:hypothetical protein AB0G04_18875 [Actinoplanes sp. NPDC023801]|uniref:hypothetical protein n=1 Tax=Actinoplanes sp. NPDC023801 TaxID=3154595 RepID=UPI0033F74272
MSKATGVANAPGPAGSNGTSAVKQVIGQGKEAATHAAADVRDTVGEQAQRVGAEAQAQVRTIVAEVRDKVGEHARTQSDTLVTFIREAADNLDEMRGDRQQTPAATVVARVADGGRQLADYLDRHGPEGVLQEVEDFARRRPGAFLATALAAGFVVGRLGKSVAKADAGAGAPAAPAVPATPGAAPSDAGAVAGPATGTTADPQTLLEEFTRLQQHRMARP